MPLDSVTTIVFVVYSKVYHKSITYFYPKYWAFSAFFAQQLRQATTTPV
jgi:hypothetical protein